MSNRLKEMGENAAWHLMVRGAIKGAEQAGYTLKRQPGRGLSNTYEVTKNGKSPYDALLLVSFVVTMNAVLLVFNLVPAFPLDGGRIARAGIWKLTGDRNRATKISGAIGQGFAVLLMGLGLYLAFTGDPYNGVWLAVLGYLLWSSARSAVDRPHGGTV